MFLSTFFLAFNEHVVDFPLCNSVLQHIWGVCQWPVC